VTQRNKQLEPTTNASATTLTEISDTTFSAPATSNGSGPLIVRAATALEAFRHNEYDAQYAVGEMVDNSLESGAKNVWIEYETESRKQPNRSKEVSVVHRMVVVDDGSGMSPSVLTRALVLGDSMRPADRRPGIGKFGVGLTMGGLALARSITVFSRASADEPFFGVTLDLDEVRDNGRSNLTPAAPMKPPPKYVDRLAASTGTIVVLDKCDRLQESTENDRLVKADDVIKGMPNFLGRTYRKFIATGHHIWFQGKRVFLHDPLYLMSPTMFDIPELDLKATHIRTESIDVPIPGKADGSTAPVTITVSLLPEEWRKTQGSGGSADAERRQIPDNQGVSILRADREVLYSEVPFLLGARGQAGYKESDRWWGCEISFPPELDEHFEVRFIKRGAQPKRELREQLRGILAPTIKSLRDEISRHWAKTAADKSSGEGVFEEAEEVMNSVAPSLPKSRRKTSPAETPIKTTGYDGVSAPNLEVREPDPIAKIADEAARASAPENPEQQAEVRDRTVQRLEANLFSIVPVDYPESFFFETEHHLGKVIVKLNTRHPFYREVFVPLCGPLRAGEDDAARVIDPAKRRARIAIQLLIMSYAQAESMFEGDDTLFANIRSQWGMSLGAAVKRLSQFAGGIESAIDGNQ
jgi:hypothetical protein